MTNRIAEQRLKSKMSVKELSEKTGIPEKKLIGYESPDFPIEKMSAVKAALIAEALGCCIKDLIYK